MEFILCLCCFLLFCFVLVKTMKISKSNSTSPRLPPGPKVLPIIGNMHQLFGGPVHHILRDLAKQYGPLMHLRLGELSTVFVSSPEVAKEIFKTHDLLFAQRPCNLPFKVISYDFTDIIFSPYGNYWRQLRKICIMELLSPKRVQSFRSIREEEVLNLITSIYVHDGRVANLSKKIYSLTYSITARAAFGKKSKYQEEFIHLVEETTKLLAGFSIADIYPSVRLLQVLSGMKHKLQKIHQQVDEILEYILDEHKENFNAQKHGNAEAKEDLIDILLKVQKRGDFEAPLTDSNLKAVIYDIFSAGSETSSTTVEWAMSEMIKNPETMKKAQDEVRNEFDKSGNVTELGLRELCYLQAVIKETLRLHPSAPLLVPRECGEQCEINGYEIPVKTRVIVNAWAIGRDPMYWTEPEKFKPERFLGSEIDFRGNNFEYIPFGAGRRICPGISFAIPNIELPLAQLLFHFDWKLPGGLKPEELDMTEGVGMTTSRRMSLCLIPFRHCHSSLEKED